MVDRKYIRNLPESIKSEFGKEYPIDMVREAYIHSDQGVRGFCKRYGLTERALMEFVNTGNWEAQKNAYRDRMYKTFSKNRLEILEWRQDLLTQIETLEIIAMEGLVQDIAKRFTTSGDLFLRDDEGDIVRDAYGNPLLITVPKYVKEALKLSQEVRENNTQILVEAAVSAKDSSKSEKVKRIDLLELANAETLDVDD